MITDIYLYFFWALFSVPGSQICETHPEIVTQESNPVCGAFPAYGGLNSDRPYYRLETFNNPSEACHNTSILAYRPGDCMSRGGPHRPNSGGTPHIFVDAPICFFDTGDDNTGIVAKDKPDNSLMHRVPMFFYWEGHCKDMNNTVCQEEDRGKDCEKTVSPVCGYSYVTSENGEKVFPAKLSKKTKDNACLACSDQEITFYINGSCEEYKSAVIQEEL